MEEFGRTSQVPGYAIALIKDGDIIWSETFGYADIENKIPVSTKTQFRIGSVSKPLTAAGLGLLIEQGKLDLDMPIQKYVPEFPINEGTVTIRLLAGHLAGIRHYRGFEFLSNDHYPTVTDGLSIFINDTLLYPPGERFSYSSYGWNLISAAMERAAGIDFISYMEESVFTPLEMFNTAADYADSTSENRTRFYQLDGNDSIVPAPEVDNSYKWAGGGFLSNAEDLVKLVNAHFKPGFLDTATLDTWFTPQVTSSGDETGYGIGWRTGEDCFGNRMIFHGGGSVGGITILTGYPEEKIGIAIVTNSSNVNFGDIHNRIACYFMDENPLLPEPIATVLPYLGKYELDEYRNFEIWHVNDELLYVQGSTSVLLVKDEDGGYVTLNGNLNLWFNIDEMGVTKVDIKTPNGEFAGRRVSVETESYIHQD
jgi:CubicO group peptidase (beta-lactamase class C family)